MTAASKDQILSAVCSVFGIKDGELRGPRKHKRLAEARKAAVHHLRLYTPLSLKDTARLFRKSQCWVSWAVWACSDQAEVDKAFAARCKAIQDLLDHAAKAVS